MDFSIDLYEEIDCMVADINLETSHFYKLNQAIDVQIKQQYEDVSAKYNDKVSKFLNQSTASESAFQNADSAQAIEELKIRNLTESVNEEKKLRDKKIRDIQTICQKITKLSNDISVQDNLKDKLTEKMKMCSETGKSVLELYEKHLALKLNITESKKLVFTFTQVSEKDPLKEYSLIFRYESGYYRLLGTVPAIFNLKALEDAVNQTEDLAGFLAYLRARFVEIANGRDD